MPHPEEGWGGMKNAGGNPYIRTELYTFKVYIFKFIYHTYRLQLPLKIGTVYFHH